MKILKSIYKVFFYLIIFIAFYSCKAQENNFNSSVSQEELKGFSLMGKLPGLWSGPVTSTTPAGSFDNWFVDLRAVSSSQISQFSLLDANTINNYSFFVGDFQGQKRIVLRTEGCFANSCCVTYEVLDSVNEANNYYRFSDFIGGTNRAYTEIVFDGEYMKMDVYTSKFNKENKPVLHSSWKAQRHDFETASKTSELLNYPQAVSVVDLTEGFKNMKESIFFEFNTDPYKTEEQPYVGNINLKILSDPELEIKDENEIEILITIKPLFEGVKYIESNLKYASKIVLLPGDTKSFTINNIHPGKYYIYAFVDLNGDKLHTSGEYMSSKGIPEIIVEPDKGTDYEIIIDMVIP